MPKSKDEQRERYQRGQEHYYRERFLNKVKKKITRPANERPVRRKGWSPDAVGDDEPMETAERVVPRGEKSRREAAVEQAVAALEQEADLEPVAGEGMPGGLAVQRGIVVEVSAGLARVDVGREALLCRFGSAVQSHLSQATPIAVGDRVAVTDLGQGRGVIESVQTRGRVLSRPDVHNPRFSQVVAANVDQLLIVASWRDPAVWLELIDRYLITARRNNLDLVIALSKIDLAEDLQAPRDLLRPYRELEVPAVLTSAYTGLGLTELADLLRGRTTVLAGLSGAGKSSLINAIEPDLHIRTGQVAADGAGRHTTTQVRLWALPTGGAVIDTPGVREWGLAGLHRRDLAAYYPEIAALADECRFRDCLHSTEPDCAVRRQATAGILPPARYESYLKILQTLPA